MSQMALKALKALNRISQVIQTEATTTSIGDFLITHVPFENLYLDNTKAITENELFKNILIKNRDEHKFIMVQGSNGSGKSHLIRWLKEKYQNSIDPQKEGVLLISRAHNTLQDALKQLLEADIFPNEIKENELKHIKNAKSNITGEELKKTINFNFTLEVDADDVVPDAILDTRSRKWLSTYLKDNYIINEFLMSKSGPLERIRAKIEITDENSVNRSEDPMFTPDDFNITIAQIRQKLNVADGRAADFTIRFAEKLADTRNGAELRQKVADYLNTKVSNVIQRSMKLQTADFKNLFVSLRKILKKQGMNLTLFVEDINSFTGIDEALIEVLLTDHSAEGNHDYCRIKSVVGSTNAFFRDRLNASIRERIKTNIYIQEKSVLGTKAQLSKFAAKYINAINLSDEKVKTWAENDASDESMPVYECQYKFSNVDCNGAILSIFPFNDTALWKLYNSLSVEKKTPRVFLKNVIAHTLKLWFKNPQGFLSNEDNFSNGEISMPRWESQLYNQKNKDIDGNSVTERGILLKLWGDGTANETIGRLGGLTADVFKAFSVYASITGEAKPITQNPTEDKTISMSEKTAQYNSTPKVAKNPKFIDIEEDLANWIIAKDPSKNKLANHIELRDYLYNFIVSSIDWELEGVPMLLVNSYINTRSRVFIEGQPTNIGDGFELKRSDESVLLLTALISWRYLGNNTWNFEGSADYLVTATAWIVKYKAEIIKLVIAPKNKYDEWNLPLWNVAALYCIKTLFGGLDISKSSEDIAVDLLGITPIFTEQSTHSTAWQELQKIVTKNDYFKINLVKDTLAYFSKSVGSAEAGETKYVFVDTLEILKQIRKLKSLQWNLEGLCPIDTDKFNSTWYYSANLIKVFLHSITKIVEDENAKAETYLSFFKQIFDNDFNEQSVTASLQCVRDFLKFLSDYLNLSYVEEDFKAIKPSTAAPRLVAALNRVERLGDNQKVSETLMKISKNPFDEIDKFYASLIAFNNLLNEKEDKFSVYIDTVSNEAIEKYRNEINSDIIEMLKKINSIGDGIDGEN